MRRSVALLAAMAIGAALAPACSSSSSSPPPPPVVPCDSLATLDALPPIATDTVWVKADHDGPMALAAPDVVRYLQAMWGGSVTESDADKSDQPLSIVISTSDAARALTTPAATDDYAIERVDHAGKTELAVWAKDEPTLAAASYALLEELGARFFHPKQELIPKLTGAHVPATLHVHRKAATKIRGLQLHTLHPIDWFKPFNEPSPDNLADAKLFIDWLAKTGQNHVQWCLLSTVDYAALRPHAQAILDYAHSRGVTVSTVVQVWGGAALQNNYVLVKDAANWQSQMDTKLDELTTVPWDGVELALGEFVSTDPQSVIDWLSHATDYTLKKLPNAWVNVQNHVGNYPQLYVQYQGQTVFYYHLPQFADPRLGQAVHTLFFFDMYRNWAMYNHPDFHLQHDYIVKELPSRRVWYFPESAYWVTADVDVPAFLPEFIHARWNDIHTLVPELVSAGLPPLEGHVTFSSGHEWGYWMTDYLTAKLLWQADAPLDQLFSHYAAAYGSCAGDVAQALSQYTAVQSKYLFDQKLVGYISGEDATIDVGYLAGIPTHPRRVQLEEIVAMNDADRAAFEQSVVAALEAMVAEAQPIEDAVAARCRGSDAALAPWCNELWDGIAIVRLRAEHAALLNRSILAYARGDKGEASKKLDAARAVTDEAAKVIAKRESGYRFDLPRLTEAYDNPTYYKFGYLHQAHTQCYWRRREDQMQWYLDNDAAAPIAQIRTCDD